MESSGKAAEPVDCSDLIKSIDDAISMYETRIKSLQDYRETVLLAQEASKKLAENIRQTHKDFIKYNLIG